MTEMTVSRAVGEKFVRSFNRPGKALVIHPGQVRTWPKVYTSVEEDNWHEVQK